MRVLRLYIQNVFHFSGIVYFFSSFQRIGYDGVRKSVHVFLKQTGFFLCKYKKSLVKIKIVHRENHTIRGTHSPKKEVA